MAIRTLITIAIISPFLLAGCAPADPPSPPTITASADPVDALDPCALITEDEALAHQVVPDEIEPSDDRERVCSWVDAASGSDLQIVTAVVVGWGVDDEVAVGADLVEETTIGTHEAAVLAITDNRDWCRVVFPVTLSEEMQLRSLVAVEAIRWEGDACPDAMTFAELVEPRVPAGG